MQVSIWGEKFPGQGHSPCKGPGGGTAGRLRWLEQRDGERGRRGGQGGGGQVVQGLLDQGQDLRFDPQGRWEPWRLLPGALLGLLPGGQTKGARTGAWGPGRIAQVQVGDDGTAPGGGRGVGEGDRFRKSFEGRGLAYGLDVKEERVASRTTPKCLAQPGKGWDCHLLR